MSKQNCKCACDKCKAGTCTFCMAEEKCANHKSEKAYAFNPHILGSGLDQVPVILTSDEPDLLDTSAPFDALYEFRPKNAAKTIVEKVLETDMFNKILGQDMMEALGEVETQRAVVTKNATATALSQKIDDVATTSLFKLSYALSKKSEIENKTGVIVHDLKKDLRAIGCDLTGISFDSLERNMASYVQNCLIAS
jgi:hypothetical protein